MFKFLLAWLHRKDRVDLDVEIYRLGVSDGMDALERAMLADACRKASAFYPTPDNPNVISFARHRSWQSRREA